ncbi:MAG: hypothetical protein KA236_00130 [Verrucomicrobia bacterium]|jgi:hypothetical protein|nr:hypothetical protein [Verrucomicrobiota bacterium]
MNTILLQPTDVLFFRDGRPMSGAMPGHGAAWPLPSVINHAFHAALHRSGLRGHAHDQRQHHERLVENARQFGSLVTAGPFPVHQVKDQVKWYFPRPLDLLDDTLNPAWLPTDRRNPDDSSSLPSPLKYPTANRLPPNKENPAKTWLSGEAYQRYLDGRDAALTQDEARDDSAFSDAEATIGIAIDPMTGTTGQGEAAGKIYSAHYLRLRNHWHLGALAGMAEKNDEGSRTDLIPELINQQRQILIGGQQRLCTAYCGPAGDTLPLPQGLTNRFNSLGEGSSKRWLVKWVLLSPAIWPEIPAKSRDGRDLTPHSGGWLPNWVRQSDGQVMLRMGERRTRKYNGKHTRGFEENSSPIGAKLVAAIVPKPIVVTGWALPNHTDRPDGGAKSTHLAVPAGAVYYFEAEPDANQGPGNAIALANALNWHGDTEGTEIKNRRSTLMGEKGFGLGVCGTWNFGKLSKI